MSICFFSQVSMGSVPAEFKKLQARKPKTAQSTLIFDLPVTYNARVSFWINHFQTRGQVWFREWLERSSRYMPFIQKELKQAGLPLDLAYMVMIESGFSATAVSHADAVGPWQFIETTGVRYGLSKTWWLDERRDFKKSTQAAIKYIKDLHTEFGSWYLVAASYNMGEGGLRRKINRHETKDYWKLLKVRAIPKETQDYVPKILAAMLIAKAPSLYGFRDLGQRTPLEYDLVSVPGGTRLESVADKIGITKQAIKELNAELILGYVPPAVNNHYIRVPKGSQRLVVDLVSKNGDIPRRVWE